jgi:cation transport regulator
MHRVNVSLPEIAFVAATRGMAGAGIGLLASGHLKEAQRKKFGLALLAIGLLTTIPIAFAARRRVVRYRTIQELPKEHTDQYDGHQKEAFLKAFNGAYQKYHHHEARAFEVAHLAALKAVSSGMPGSHAGSPARGLREGDHPPGS